MTGKWDLIRGKSREAFFDCLRLGQTHEGIREFEFWGTPGMEGVSLEMRLDIEIEGVHRASNDGGAWFFWGKYNGGECRFGYPGGHPDMKFVFGKWDTVLRTGEMIFSKTSFFENPLTTFDQLTRSEA